MNPWDVYVLKMAVGFLIVIAGVLAGVGILGLYLLGFRYIFGRWPGQ